MRTLEIAVGNAVEKIRELEWRRERFGTVLQKNKKKFLLEGEPLFSEVSPLKITGKVAAVDGGLLHRGFHGFDLVLGKAVGAVFNYRGSKLLSCDYHPNAFPAPTITPVYKPLTGRDPEMFAHIKRHELEISVAKEIVEKEKIEIMLLDGSIMPHSNTEPNSDSEVKEDFESLIGKFIELYRTCEERGTVLAGIVEDSRGKRFADILSALLPPEMKDKEILENTMDTNLLYYILNQGERTAVFPYTKNPEKHHIVRKFGEYKDRIKAFYIRTAAYDRPLRIDYLETKKFDLAGKLLPLCEMNALYGIPSPIIEADARARLSSSEIEVVYNQLIDKAGNLPALLKLRRDVRPF